MEASGPMIRRSVAVLICSIFLLVPTLARAADPFQPLAHRVFRGRSITGAHHSRPIRHPAELVVRFSRDSVSGEVPGAPTLNWESNCNDHDYFLAFAHGRLHAYGQLSTGAPCPGRQGREEHWLIDFFAVDLDWTLAHGRLTLTSGERQIVLDGEWLFRTSN